MSGATAKKVATQGGSRKKKPVLTEVNVMEAAVTAAAQAAQSTAELADLPTGTVVDGLPLPDDLAESVKSPYPKGIRYFSYQPKAGGDPILLAITGFDPPSKTWHFDVAQLPVLSQTWKWMSHANIPKDIQRQAQSLPDPEYFAMFDEWFAVMKAMHAPRGAISSGK